MADLAHQRTARLQLAMARSKEEKLVRPADCAPPVLYLKTRFRHSKLQPLKQELYEVENHRCKIQRDATNLKHGKPAEFSWDWPEEQSSVRRRSGPLRRGSGRRGAGDLHNYANCLAGLQRFEEAKSLLRKTLPVARRVLGESDRTTLLLGWCYANALYKNDNATLDDLREAVGTFESIAPLWKRIKGQAHPETANVQRALKAARAALALASSGSALS